MFNQAQGDSVCLICIFDLVAISIAATFNVKFFICRNKTDKIVFQHKLNFKLKDLKKVSLLVLLVSKKISVPSLYFFQNPEGELNCLSRFLKFADIIFLITDNFLGVTHPLKK